MAGVWAFGDLTAHHPLKHLANAEARVLTVAEVRDGRLAFTDIVDTVQAVLSRHDVPSEVMIEAIRQVRGECGQRQVKHCDVALAQGNGGVLSSECTVIFGSEKTL